MKNLRLTWQKGKGWLAHVEALVPEQVLHGACKFALKINKERYLGLPVGDKKEELKEAIKDLMNLKVQQFVTAKPNKEIILY